MYKIILDCESIGPRHEPADSSFSGFISVKFEAAGDVEAACAAAIYRTKVQMAEKGFREVDIDGFKFEVNEVSEVDASHVNSESENAFVYY